MNGFAHDYERYCDAEAERLACEADSFEMFCEETGYDPEDEQTVEAWKQSLREEVGA